MTNFEQVGSAPLPVPAYRRVPDAPWRRRVVLWALRDGVEHIIIHAASIGSGVLGIVACGGSTPMWVHSDTWYGVKHDGGRVCRKCAAILASAGANGTLLRK